MMPALFSRLALVLSISVLMPAMRSATVENTAVPPMVDLEFTLIGWESDTPEFMIDMGARKESLSAVAFTRSRVVRYSGPAKLDFVLVPQKIGKSTPSSEGTEPPPGASVTFPSRVKRVTILVFKGPTETWHMLAVPEIAEDFPPDHARLLNLTLHPLAVSVNFRASVAIAPGQSIIVPAENARIIFRVALSQDGHWVPVLNNMIGVKPEERSSLVFTQSEAEIFQVYNGDTPMKNGAPLQFFILPPWPKTPPSDQTQ